MPDSRKHRGPHPEDERLFSASEWGRLREATHDLSWLLERGYAGKSALKIVGDRYQLTTRQREAVGRSAFGESAVAGRLKREVTPGQLKGRALEVDGFNVLTTLEVALSGGVLLVGRDGAVRDVACMHGAYRFVEESLPAMGIAVRGLEDLGCASCHWYFDQPVSNSGRLSAQLKRVASGCGYSGAFQTEVIGDPDQNLRESEAVVATADRGILDSVNAWFNLAGYLISWARKNEALPGETWMVDLGSPLRGGE